MKKSRAWKEINKILLEDWNPIEIDDIPEDENIGYISGIYSRLERGTNEKGLNNLLIKNEQNMGCQLEPNKRKEVVAKLLGLNI